MALGLGVATLSMAGRGQPREHGRGEGLGKVPTAAPGRGTWLSFSLLPETPRV